MGNLVFQDSGGGMDVHAPAARYMQRFFLARLARMVALRDETENAERLKTGEPDRSLLDKAVYSTLCDCLDLGSGEEARAVLRGENLDLRGSELIPSNPEQGTS